MSFNKDNLVKQFRDAGLVLEMAKEPFARGANATAVFGMDIRRRFGNNTRSEYFIMWPGDEENIVNIAAVDKKIHQLVLTVKEPEREFEQLVQPLAYRAHIKKYGSHWLDKWIEETKPVVPRRGRSDQNRSATKSDFVIRSGDLFVKTRTANAIRHFLLGVDERQLFIAQLQHGATSVKQAMESLKAPTVILAEGKQLGRTYRQGEWFFLNLTKEEKEELSTYLKRSLKIIHKKANIGRFAGRSMGKPHIVDELIVLKARAASPEYNWPVRRRDDVFVRGAVRHPDHETLKIGDWRKVILNNERNNAAAAASFGGTWID